MLISAYVHRWSATLFGSGEAPPWNITQAAPDLIRKAIAALGSDYRRIGEMAAHSSAEVETGATVKGPAIIGPRSFVAASALLRGGVFIDEDCIVVQASN